MIGNLCDPDYEPTDEELEWLMREMMADVRLSHERIRQKLAKQIEDEMAEKPDDTERACWLVRPSEALKMHLESIPAIVAAHRCTNPRVFGSVLRGEDHLGSDLDLLVDPTEGTTLFDIGGLQYDLIELLGVRVQVVTPGDLPDKWRQQVIDEAKPLDYFK